MVFKKKEAIIEVENEELDTEVGTEVEVEEVDQATWLKNYHEAKFAAVKKMNEPQ